MIGWVPINPIAHAERALVPRPPRPGCSLDTMRTRTPETLVASASSGVAWDMFLATSCLRAEPGGDDSLIPRSLANDTRGLV